ncbi:MucR family transcriptional regulator [Agrobacterium salinitolerans]|nr:MucR family transcriptional regulator [Agrobacterium salinitolerans]
MSIISNPKIIRSAEGSVTDDGIYCLFDNQRRVMLSRYVEAKYGMTPDRYKEYCGLPADYPMTAKSYEEECKRLANGGDKSQGHLRLVEIEEAMDASQSNDDDQTDN